MIETIMYVGIGLLFGCLLAVAIVPLVHNRAVRLTAKRLEGLPQSIAEIQVDKDLLRAEFAMSARRFEIPSNRNIRHGFGSVESNGSICKWGV